MNHIYGLVWSATRQAWVVVAEIAAGCGRKDSTSRHARRRLRRAMIAAPLAASVAVQALAQTAILAPGQNGRTYTSPNGTTVVDINSANAAGVSHNQFTQYNVSNRGLVLNNTTGGGANRSASQLAGSVATNAYSSRAAKLIINEVTSANPSTLAGFTEVVGQRADVVVANPYGITCSGCGFINTDRVTLTTGAPRWNTDGSLAGFNVQQGNIAITGSGLNASAQQILDLVSRSVTLNGAVNARDLGIFAGTGTWNYANRGFDSTGTGTGAAPNYAIDASALGAMYANQIHLVANEAGVGVRLLGDVAAQVGDVTIAASGTVTLNNHVSAIGGVRVASTGGDVALSQTTLSAGGDLTLSGNNVGLDAGSQATSNGATSIQATGAFTNAGSVQAQGNLQATSSSGITNQGTLTSGQDLTLSGATVNLASGSQTGATGAMSLNATGAITNAGTTQAQGTLQVASTGGGVTNQGTLASTQDLTLSGTGISLASGSQTASDGAITIIAAGPITGSGTVQAQGNLTVAATGADITLTGATLAAGQNMALSAGNISLDHATQVGANGTMAINAVGAITNAGAVQAQNGLTITSSSLDNAGNVLSTNGDATVTVANALVNEANNAFVGSGTANLAANGKLTVVAGNLKNAGLLGGSTGMSVQTRGNLTNTSTGSMQTLGSLALNAGNVFQNSGSVTSSADGAVSAQSFFNDPNAQLRTAYGLSLTLNGPLQNSGTIQAGTGAQNELMPLSIADANGSVTNTATGVMQGGGLSVNAQSLNNMGGITAGAGGSTMTLSTLQNQASGMLTLGNANSAMSTVNAGNIDNFGTVQTARDLTINLGGQLSNGGASSAGKLLTGGALTIQGAATYTPLVVANNGLIDAQGALSIQGANAYLKLNGSSSTQAASMNIRASTVAMGSDAELVSQGDLALTSGWLTTATGTNGSGAATTSRIMGGMSGSGTTTVNAITGLDLNGLIYSKGNVNVTAPNITVEQTGALAALNNLSVTANAAPLDLSHVISTAQTYQNTDIPTLTGNVTNYGTIYAGNTLNMRVPGALTNAIKVNTSTRTINNAVLSALQIPANAITTLNLDGSATTTYTSISNGTLYTYALNSTAANTAVSNTVLQSGINPSTNAPYFAIPTAQTQTINGTVVTTTYPATTVSNSDGTSTTTFRAISFDNSTGVYSLTATTAILMSGTYYVTTVTGKSSTLTTTARTLTAQGEITAGNNMNIVANTLINNSDITTLNAGGTLQIVATTLRNEVQGGDQRVITTNYNPNWLTASLGDTGNAYQTPGTPAGWTSIGSQWSQYVFPDLYEANNYYLNYWEKTAFSENLKPVYNPTIIAAGNAALYFHNGSNLAGLIQATGNLTMQGFVTQQAQQTPSGPAAPSGAMLGNMQDGVGNYVVAPPGTTSPNNVPVFTNDSLQEQMLQYAIYRTADKQWEALGNLQYTAWGWCSPNSGSSGAGGGICQSNGRGYGFTPVNMVVNAQANPDAINSPGARIYANALAGGDFTLYNQATVAPAAYDVGSSTPAFSTDLSAISSVNSGGTARVVTPLLTTSAAPSPGSVNTAPPTTPQPQSTVLPGLGNQTGWTPVSSNVVSNGSSLTFGGISIHVPTSPNGMFILAPNPKAGYLIEGNPLYLTGSTVGSDYLMTLLGFSTDATTIRLGDGSYETWLVQQELITQTGSMLLKGYGSLADEMRGLMKAASMEQTNGLGLIWGQAPTDAQLAKLTSDIVWMVKSTVNGQEVLVPVVYLCKATKDSIQSGAIIQANSGTLKVNGQGNNGTVVGVAVTNVGGGKGQPSLFPSVGGGQNFNDETFQIIKTYLQSTNGGAALGISDVNGWLAKNQNDPTALGKVLPYAYERFMSLAESMQHGQGQMSANDIAFVNYVAEYAKQQRLAAIQKALNDYDAWKKDEDASSSKNKTLTSLFGHNAIPPQWIMNEGESGILLGDQAHQQALGTMVGTAFGVLAGGAAAGAAAGGAVLAGGALTATGTVMTSSLMPFASAATVEASAGGPVGILAAFATMAAVGIYELVEGMTFYDRMKKMQQTVEAHSATDFNYWLGDVKGGAMQMSLSLAQLMMGANPNMTTTSSN